MDYAEQLSRLIRCETVSEKEQKDPTKFERFHEVLWEVFPRLRETVTAEVFHGSLLMKWAGRNPEKSPVFLMSHHDVVEATGDWKYPPFSGAVAEGRLWGRGTLDTKGNLWAMLAAAEELMAEGFQPDCDVYFISSCNEESTGLGGQEIVRVLKERNIRAKLLLDEGGMILPEPMPGAEGLFAMIGVAEKGCADLRFVARGNGGHASAPGKDTPLVRLGKFMAAAEKAKLFPAEIHPVTAELMRRLAPHMKGMMKFLFSHLSLTKPLLTFAMPRVSPTAGGLLKTTLAFTMAGGAEGSNVLPETAWVIGNMRFSLHQGREDSIRAVTELARRFDIETEVLDPGVVSPVSDINGEGYHLVEETIREVFPTVTPAPYVMLGASDSRFFGEVAESCIRFAPFTIDDQQFASMHGLNENVSLDTLEPAVRFFKNILRKV